MVPWWVLVPAVLLAFVTGVLSPLLWMRFEAERARRRRRDSVHDMLFEQVVTDELLTKLYRPVIPAGGPVSEGRGISVRSLQIESGIDGSH